MNAFFYSLRYLLRTSRTLSFKEHQRLDRVSHGLSTSVPWHRSWDRPSLGIGGTLQLAHCELTSYCPGSPSSLLGVQFISRGGSFCQASELGWVNSRPVCQVLSTYWILLLLQVSCFCEILVSSWFPKMFNFHSDFICPHLSFLETWSLVCLMIHLLHL